MLIFAHWHPPPALVFAGVSFHTDSAVETISHAFTIAAKNITYTFGYNKANQITNRHISNIAYVFDGFKAEGTTDYAVNGLNQYTGTDEAPPLAAGETVANPDREAERSVVLSIWLLGAFYGMALKHT